MPRFMMRNIALPAALSLCGAVAWASVPSIPNLSALTSTPVTIAVQAIEPSTDPAESLAALTLEERQRMRSQIRDQRESMAPEELQHLRAERQERWRQMSPEERQRIRQAIRQQRIDAGGRRPTAGLGGSGPADQ